VQNAAIDTPSTLVHVTGAALPRQCRKQTHSATILEPWPRARRFLVRRFLKAVLVLGNKMNGITAKNRKGVVKAFTIQSLHQLHLTKAFDQQTSVLQYLIRLLKHRDPDLLRLSQVR